METATELATKAADPFLQQGTLGATVVALALTIVVIVVFGWRALDKKDRKIAELEKGWRDDIRTTLGSVTTAVATLGRVESALEQGRKR